MGPFLSAPRNSQCPLCGERKKTGKKETLTFAASCVHCDWTLMQVLVWSHIQSLQLDSFPGGGTLPNDNHRYLLHLRPVRFTHWRFNIFLAKTICLWNLQKCFHFRILQVGSANKATISTHFPCQKSCSKSHEGCLLAVQLSKAICFWNPPHGWMC